MSSKLDFHKQKISNPAEQLRAQLSELEDQSVSLAKQGKNAVLSYLAAMDAAQALIDQIEVNSGPDLTAAKQRFDTLKKGVQKKAPTLLKIVGGATVLRAERPAGALPDTAVWWFLDEYTAQQKAKQRSRITKLGVVILIVLAGVIILFNTLLKPDPNVVLKVQFYDAALQHVNNAQDYNAALTEIEQALQTLPDDAELHVFKGALLELLGRPNEAASAYDAADKLFDRPEFVPLSKGQILWQLSLPEPALDATLEAIAINPESAETWFLAGQIYSGLEQIPQAREALSNAADLAFAQGQDTLYTLAKVNLGYLPPAPLITATPE